MADEDARDYSSDGADALAYGLAAMARSDPERAAAIRGEVRHATDAMLAEFRDRWVPLVRQVEFAEQDFDALFMPRFICRTCGPTNRIVGGSEGFVCVVCQQAAAHQIMHDHGLGPHV